MQYLNFIRSESCDMILASQLNVGISAGTKHEKRVFEMRKQTQHSHDNCCVYKAPTKLRNVLGSTTSPMVM